VELKVYKQRMKTLLLEHQNDLTNAKTDYEQKLLQVRLNGGRERGWFQVHRLSLPSRSPQVKEDHKSQEAELRKENRALKLELKENELAHEDFVKDLKQSHAKQMALLRSEYEQKVGGECARSVARSIEPVLRCLQIKIIQEKNEENVKQLRENMDMQRKNQV